MTAAVLVLFLPALAGREATPGENNYFALKNLYTKWHEGLFGSRNYYKRELYMFCVDLIDRDIETEPDYILLSPESIHEKSILCRLPHARWLYIHGPVDVRELRQVIKKDPLLLKNWWRSGRLLKAAGKVRKFRLSRDRYGDTVDLWLHRVTVSEK